MTLRSREREILVLRAHGLTMPEVAHVLGLSRHTVRVHVTSAYARLGVSYATEAYLALGWLTPPPHDALAGASGSASADGSDDSTPGGRVASQNRR